jgi:ribosomal protein S18 acetylase RimI-like enzyme
MNIKKLSEHDLPELAELFKQFWGENSSLEKMGTTFKRLVENPAYILLAAKLDGKLAGFIMGVICEELYGDCQPFLVMEDFVVDKNHRRSGIGATLMKTLEGSAIECGCSQIIFLTEANRPDAIGFYLSQGYEHNPYKGFKKQLE